MAECKYRTDKDGKLCTYNAHPKVVECLYEVKTLVSELSGQHEGLDELIEAIEYELFVSNGIDFAHWLRNRKLRKEIDNLKELKVNSWDKPKVIKLKKQIRRLLYRVVR